MFRHTAPAVEAAENEQGLSHRRDADLIPLSVLRLDLDPAEPWPTFLGRRGIAFRPDRIGRDAISAGDAQRLLEEKREDQVRQAALRRAQEAEAIADDQRRRAQIWKGIPATALPPGAAPAAVMLQADKESQPRRQSVLQESLAGESMVYHAWPNEDES